MAKKTGFSSDDFRALGTFAGLAMAAYGVYQVIKRKELSSRHGLMALAGLAMSIPWKRK